MQQHPASDPAPTASRREFLEMAAVLGLAQTTWLTGCASSRTHAADALPETAPVTWSDMRKLFALPADLVYLNNGSLGPAPVPAIAAVRNALTKLQRNPVTHYYGPLIKQTESVRAQAAAFLGCTTPELAVTNCTTDAMNMIAQGIDLQPGDRVLTTDHEHAGGSLCWQYYVDHRGVIIDRVILPTTFTDADQIVALFRRKLTAKTRVISVSHVTYTTGLRLPVRSLAELARTQDALLIVDGAQAPGALRVDLRELRCHAYATSAHKWLLAPAGTGLLYINTDVRERIAPIALAAGPRVYTGATGTRNLVNLIGLGVSLDILTRLGPARVEKHLFDLRDQLIRAAAAIPGLELVSPQPRGCASALTTFRLPATVKCAHVVRVLRDKHGIIVKPVTGHNLNAIRVSLHIYNTPADIAKFADTLKTSVA